MVIFLCQRNGGRRRQRTANKTFGVELSLEQLYQGYQSTMQVPRVVYTRDGKGRHDHSTITIEARWLCFPFSWLCFPFSFPTYISTPPPPLLPIRLVSM